MQSTLILTSPQKSDVILTAEQNDRIIKQKIQNLTSENNLIWTSPEHSRRDYVHSFFQYPAMMVPVVQKKIISIIREVTNASNNVIDPFMGSATSLVACMELGLNCYGQDVNPLAVLIAEARTGPYPVSLIRSNLNSFFQGIYDDKSDEIETQFSGLNKWFKTDVAIEISKIVRAVRKESDLNIRRFYWVNLAEVIRISSNDRTSTFKLHSRSREEIEIRNISPIKEFNNRLNVTVDDLNRYRDLLKEADQLEKDSYRHVKCISLQDSSKRINTPNDEDEFFDLLVTSPPYGDNKTTVTYGQHSYLPLQWIDFSDIGIDSNKEILKSTLEIDSRSLGGRLRLLTDSEIQQLVSISESFLDVYNKLLKTTPERVKKVLVFIDDLFQVIKQIFRVMKVNSYQVWTVGNRTVGGVEIPNNKIIKEIIESMGGILVTHMERTILNKRMAKRNSASVLMNTEEILIFRKLG